MNEDIIKKLKVGYYLDLLLRHRWLIIITFFIFMVAGIFFSLTRPSIYQASTFIKVIPRSVPEEYVPSVTEEDVGERINTISLEIKSRTNIEAIIEKYELFKGSEYKNMYMEDKIAAVRRNISVNVTKSRKGIDSFTLSYKGSDPEKVKDVVNSLAESFIDESIKVIGDEVVGTKKFLESELDNKAERLDEVNEAVKKFREEHLGELPEQLEANLRNLERLQEKQISKQESLRDTEHRQVQLEQEMAEVLKGLNTLENNLAEIEERQKRMTEENVSTQIKPESEDVLKLKELQEQYILLTGRYTEKHPDIIKLKDIIEQLKEKISEDQKELSEKTEIEVAKNKNNILTADLIQMKQIQEQIEETRKQYAEMEKLHAEIIRDIKLNKEDVRKIIQQIDMYEARVENTPKVELKLLALERDLKPIQKSYDALLEKREDAVVAVKMETEQKGQRFRIVDEAKEPQKPVSPNVKKLFAFFAAAGLGIGIGLTVLLDFLDTSLRRPEDVEPFIGVPMLVTIPKIYKAKDKIIYRIKMALMCGSLMITFCVLSVFVVLAFRGVGYIKKIITHLPYNSEIMEIIRFIL